MRRLLLPLLLLVAVAPAWAANNPEQRCTDMGADCLCAETLNTNSIVDIGTGSHFNPTNSTVKQCSFELPGQGDFVVTSSPGALSGHYIPVTTGEAINALPAGHQVTTVWRNPNGDGTSFSNSCCNLGHFHPGSAPTARIAARWYTYFSQNYAEYFDSICDQSNHNAGKMAEFSDSNQQSHTIMQWNGSGVPMLMYGWAPGGVPPYYTAPGMDFANLNLIAAPGWFEGGAAPTLTKAYKRGKWFRFEVTANNVSGATGINWQMYIKDVTTPNTPEWKIIDTTIQCATGVCGNAAWTVGATTSLTPPSGRRVQRILVENFHYGCPGWEANSHYLTAAWSTNSGQRIGAAIEIEGGGGGGGPTQTPASPTNLTVTPSSLVAGGALLLALVLRARRRHRA